MEKEIVIKPEGWTKWLFIESGDARCGLEHHGVGIGIIDAPDSMRYGGVIRREDMQRIVDLFTEHSKEYPLS